MKKILAKLNYPLLILTIIYAIFGCLMIYSASSISAILRYDVSTARFVTRQVETLILGVIAGIFLIFTPTTLYKYVSKIAMFVAIGALALLFVYGKVAGGALSWFDVGRVNIQPSELTKPILIIYLAVYYYRISQKKKISFWDMFYPLILCAIMVVLIAIQPDMGSAFIVFLITASTFLAIPIGKNHKKTIYKIGAGGAVLVLVLSLILALSGKNILHSYQVKRLVEYRQPCKRYQEDTGYQVCNGYIAIHNGGAFGVGLGNSTQKYLYLPEAHTDFIFPIICEECGLIIGIIVLLGYFVMLLLMLHIAKNSQNLKNSIIAYGIFTYFTIHILLNILGVLGLIPLTGVPLPFLSYGGSVALNLGLLIGLTERVAIESKLPKKKTTEKKVA